MKALFYDCRLNEPPWASTRMFLFRVGLLGFFYTRVAASRVRRIDEVFFFIYIICRDTRVFICPDICLLFTVNIQVFANAC
jgi:hypothetical protein